MRNSLEISHTTHIHTRCDHKLIEKKEEIEKPTCVEILPLITQQGRRKMKKMSFGINGNFVFMVLS